MTINSIGSGENLETRQGAIPTEDDLFWPAAMRDIQIGLVRSSQTAAVGVLIAALIGWATVVVGLVAGMVAHTEPVAVCLTMWLLPLAFWSLAVIWTLRVFSVRRYRYFANSPDSTQKAVERIGRKKMEHLYWAVGFWVAGVLSLICALIYEVLCRT
jgi:hypothetical protein